MKEIVKKILPYLTKDIAIVDLETTGVDTKLDKIVQICILRINLDGSYVVFESLVNPEKDIPKEASDVHGITNDKVKNAPTFKKLAPQVVKLVSGADFGGFNVKRFDIVLLDRELSDIGYYDILKDTYIVDSYLEYVANSSRKLEDAYKFYTNKELQNAHDAKADVFGCAEILAEQLTKANKTTKEISEIHCEPPNQRVGFSGHIKFKDGIPVWGFGKNKDKPINSDRGYLNWVLNQDFPKAVKDYIKDNT